MSIVYCTKHDRHWDSDKVTSCGLCDTEFLESAFAYAKERWYWDDETAIEELYGNRPPIGDISPEEWIDELAEKYDLYDFKDAWA